MFSGDHISLSIPTHTLLRPMAPDVFSNYCIAPVHHLFSCVPHIYLALQMGPASLPAHFESVVIARACIYPCPVSLGLLREQRRVLTLTHLPTRFYAILRGFSRWIGLVWDGIMYGISLFHFHLSLCVSWLRCAETAVVRPWIVIVPDSSHQVLIIICELTVSLI